MKIGLISDTHDRLDATAQAIRLLTERAVGVVLHCGDITAPACVQLFLGTPVQFVWGNNDWRQDALREAIAEIGATVHEPFGQLELAGKRLAWVHGDDWNLLHQLEHGGEYDYLFHGHTHVVEDRQRGPTRVINPGALHRVRIKTVAVLDVSSGELERIVVE